MPLKQQVTLEVHDEPTGGSLVLLVTGLRVDFDIRMIPGYSKAKFTIYNLNNDAITSLMDGDRYVTLKTKLHSNQEHTLAERYYVNNATDELTLPNRITNLFCFDNLKKKVLEKQVVETVKPTNLDGMVRQLLKAGGHSGGIAFKSFPETVLNDIHERKSRPLRGSVGKCLKELGHEFNFNAYTYKGGFNFMYKPDFKSAGLTSLATKEPDIILSTNAMRSNPKIGIANAQIVSNLDPFIYPTKVLDLSKLLTIAVNSPESSLELTKGYLKSFSSFSKYQSFAVQHRGSNYTASWETIINANSPSKGTSMPTVAWMKANA